MKPERFPARHPIDVSKTAWFYEERGHINVVAEAHNAGGYLGTSQTKIPFKLLCRAVDRYRKAKRRATATKRVGHKKATK